MKPLTSRQYQIFSFIADFINVKGYSPSLQEIGQGMNLASLATVHKHVNNLCLTGHLMRDYNRTRSLAVTPEADKWHKKLIANKPPQCAGCVETARVLDAIAANATADAIRSAVISVSTGIKAALRAREDPKFAKEAFQD